MKIVEILVDIVKEVRLSGFLDIAFIAVFIYSFLVLFKQSKARFIVTGIVIISVIYLIARVLDLVLTTSLLQAFFAVILLALIIIFQEEIRRFFEQIALWSLNPKLKSYKPTNPREKEIGILTDTLTDLANHKIGALIILKGNTSISDYLEGGELLEGRVSESLLKSIFDPHSVGHDGAVVIEKGIITMFATHLPLSKNFSQLRNRGTRHAAALGLSEVTDALCLVVSEERGAVSTARNGELRQIVTGELNVTLEKFYDEIYPPAKKTTRIDFSSNYKEKIIALVMAVLLWFVFVHESRPVYRNFEIPIQNVSLPAGLKVKSIDPETITATFLGPRRKFYFFSAGEVNLLLRVPDPQSGVEGVNITESDIKFPNDISLENIEPRRVMVQIEEAEVVKNEGGNPEN